MKNIIFALVLSAVFYLPAVPVQAEDSPAPRRTLRVANWSMYIDFDDTMDPALPAVERSPSLREFVEKYNCDLEYHEFDSMNAMLDKSIQLPGFYDVMVISCGYTGAILPLNVLMPVNRDLIPNLQTLDQTTPFPPADPEGQFLTPYLSDYVGLAFRKDKIGKDRLTWRDYFDPPVSWKGHIGMMGIVPVTFATAVISEGKDYPTATEADLDIAQKRIANLVYHFDPLIKNDDMVFMEQILAGDIWVAPMYTPIAQALLSRGDENIGFVIPEDGSEFYYDYFVIHKLSKNVETAHLFINHILDPKVLGRIAATLGTGAPSAAARAVRNRLKTPLVPDAVDENGIPLERLQITFTLNPMLEARWLKILQSKPTAQ